MQSEFIIRKIKPKEVVLLEDIIVDSNISTQRLVKRDKATLAETNIYQNQDFTLKTFITIPTGTNRIVVVSDTGVANVEIIFRNEFIGV